MANKDTAWVHNKWRPLTAWIYMATCIADFILFPILWSLLQSYAVGDVTLQWNPITLQGAGLFHVAMGAILGVTSWQRGREKVTALQTGVMHNDSYYSQSHRSTNNSYNNYNNQQRVPTRPARNIETVDSDYMPPLD